jgi:hypothetical protein
MLRNIYCVVATVGGLILLLIAALDWNARSEFLFSLSWK